MMINWAVNKIVNPALNAQYTSNDYTVLNSRY